MNIAVLIKQVPDTYGTRTLDARTHTVDRRVDPVVDEINERALEAALRIKESQSEGGRVTVVTMGPAKALDALRKALAMGADKAVHILDDSLAGSDAVQTSAALAAALARGEYDLVVTGNESTDGRTAAVPAMLAERLGLPQLTFLRSLTVADGRVTGERVTDEGYLDVAATLPALVSVTEQVAEARFPNFRGIMSAKKKPVEVLSRADLGISEADAGGANSWSVVQSVSARPARSQGTIVTDDGTAGTQIADFLAAAKLI